MNATRWDKTKTSKKLMCESMVINSVGLNCCRSAVIQIMIEIKTGVLNSTSTILTRIEFAHYHCKPIDLNKFIHRFKWKWKMRKRNQILTALFYAYTMLMCFINFWNDQWKTTTMITIAASRAFYGWSIGIQRIYFMFNFFVVVFNFYFYFCSGYFFFYLTPWIFSLAHRYLWQYSPAVALQLDTYRWKA